MDFSQISEKTKGLPKAGGHNCALSVYIFWTRLTELELSLAKKDISVMDGQMKPRLAGQ